MNNTPPTRQELLATKRKLKVAGRSKKLLEDKRNSLIKKFLQVVKEAKKAQSEFVKSYQKAYQMFTVARSLSDKKYFDMLAEFSESTLEISSEVKNVLGVKITSLKIAKSEIKVSYSKLATNRILDQSIEEMQITANLLVKYLELVFSAKALSKEIIKTRRRVNSLEHIILPSMSETIKDIEFKLENMEQEKKVMLMRIKS